MLKSQRTRFARLAIMSMVALSAVTAHAAITATYTNQYHGTTCKLVPSQSSNYGAEAQVEGLALSPANTSAQARVICPATVSTTVSTFYVTNISFGIDAVIPGTSNAAVVGCDGYVVTKNSAVGITPGASGIDTTHYPNVSNIYYSCLVRAVDQNPTTAVMARINDYKVLMAYGN
jgi:hypothetical protein